MKTLALLLFLLGVYGLVDAIDRDIDARLDFVRAADEKCLPRNANESALIVSNGQQMRCAIYIRNSPGMARQLVSAAVVDIPQ